MRLGPRRSLVVGVLVTGAVALAAIWLVGRGDDAPEPVRAEAILCAEVRSVPAEASSDGLQRRPDPEFVDDPRCDELAAAPAPGEVVLARHAEADAAVGEVVLAGELRFDAEDRCFYVVTDGVPTGVVWPSTFTGRDDPPRLTGGRGSTVIALGDRFEVRGRYVPATSDCGPVSESSTGFMAGADVVSTGG